MTSKKSYIEQLEEGIRTNNYKLTSDKIITTLKTIKNDPNISARRWVWELIQNATDVKYDKEKISIQIILNEDTLEFKHNGKFFTINNILGLLQQMSSKNSQNLEGQTNKFGTGLLVLIYYQILLMLKEYYVKMKMIFVNLMLN